MMEWLYCPPGTLLASPLSSLVGIFMAKMTALVLNMTSKYQLAEEMASGASFL